MEENVIQINGGITIKNVCKKRHVCEKKLCLESCYIICKNGEYSASIMDGSAIIFNEVIESYYKEKTVPTNFDEKEATCKTPNFYILLAFLLMTIVLLIAVSIYFYLIKY